MAQLLRMMYLQHNVIQIKHPLVGSDSFTAIYPLSGTISIGKYILTKLHSNSCNGFAG
jgi:hypothetical protein